MEVDQKSEEKDKKEDKKEDKDKKDKKGEEGKDGEKKDEEKKKKEPEPNFEILANPARVMKAQLRVLSMPDKSRYQPIKEVFESQG